MLKFLITSFLMLIMATPLLAKPKEVYPVSCDDLWAAVKDTLNNPNNYGISSVNDVEQKASFVVIGALVVYTDRVALAAKTGGCGMKTTILEDGPDNPDWRQFHHRVQRSLTKLQAAKPKQTITVTGQQ